MIRFLFIALLLTFGACMFLAGAHAPPEVRDPLVAVADHIGRAFASRYHALMLWLGAERAVQTAASSIPYEELMLPASTPPKQYGVQIAVHADVSSARSQREALRNVGYESEVLALGSGTTAEAYLVAVGPLASFDAAQRSLNALHNVLPIGAAPMRIAWPDRASGTPRYPSQDCGPFEPEGECEGF